MVTIGNSLEGQWLRLYAFTAKSMSLIPGQGTDISKMHMRSEAIKKKKELLLPNCVSF